MSTFLFRSLSLAFILNIIISWDAYGGKKDGIFRVIEFQWGERIFQDRVNLNRSYRGPSFNLGRYLKVDEAQSDFKYLKAQYPMQEKAVAERIAVLRSIERENYSIKLFRDSIIKTEWLDSAQVPWESIKSTGFGSISDDWKSAQGREQDREQDRDQDALEESYAEASEIGETYDETAASDPAEEEVVAVRKKKPLPVAVKVLKLKYHWRCFRKNTEYPWKLTAGSKSEATVDKQLAYLTQILETAELKIKDPMGYYNKRNRAVPADVFSAMMQLGQAMIDGDSLRFYDLIMNENDFNYLGKIIENNVQDKKDIVKDTRWKIRREFADMYVQFQQRYIPDEIQNVRLDSMKIEWDVYIKQKYFKTYHVRMMLPPINGVHPSINAVLIESKRGVVVVDDIRIKSKNRRTKDGMRGGIMHKIHLSEKGYIGQPLAAYLNAFGDQIKSFSVQGKTIIIRHHKGVLYDAILELSKNVETDKMGVLNSDKVKIKQISLDGQPFEELKYFGKTKRADEKLEVVFLEAVADDYLAADVKSIQNRFMGKSDFLQILEADSLSRFTGRGHLEPEKMYKKREKRISKLTKGVYRDQRRAQERYWHFEKEMDQKPVYYGIEKIQIPSVLDLATYKTCVGRKCIEFEFEGYWHKRDKDPYELFYDVDGKSRPGLWEINPDSLQMDEHLLLIKPVAAYLQSKLHEKLEWQYVFEKGALRAMWIKYRKEEMDYVEYLTLDGGEKVGVHDQLLMRLGALKGVMVSEAKVFQGTPAPKPSKALRLH